MYYHCQKTNLTPSGWRAWRKSCGPCTEWDQEVVACVHSSEECEAGPGPEIDDQIEHQGGMQ